MYWDFKELFKEVTGFKKNVEQCCMYDSTSVTFKETSIKIRAQLSLGFINYAQC
jgi:hypothetical protein